MDGSTDRLENQVQFWSLLGPILFLISIFVLIIKLSTAASAMSWVFPVAILLAIPLIVKWKLSGMMASVAMLLLLMITSYSYLQISERYWYVGMSISLTLCFVIFTLTQEEAKEIIATKQQESKKNIDQLLELDFEREKSLEKSLNDLAELQNSFDKISKELELSKQDKESFYKLAQLAKTENIQFKNELEVMAHEINYKRHQISQLVEKLDENELNLQQLIDQSNITQANITQANNDSADDQLQLEVDKLKHELELSYIQYNSLKVEFTDLENLKEAKNDECLKLNHKLSELSKQLVSNEVAIKELQASANTSLTTSTSDDNLKNEIQKNSSLINRVSELQHQLEKTISQQDLLKQQYESQLAGLGDKLYIQAEQNRDFHSKNRELTQQVCDLKAHIAELEGSSKWQTISTISKPQVLSIFNNFLENKSKKFTARSQQFSYCGLDLSKFDLKKITNLRSKVCVDKLAFKSLSPSMMLSDVKESADYRKLRGLYSQLKDQFKDKTDILDETRKNLFVVDEQRLVLQKELDEIKNFSGHAFVDDLTDNFMKLSADYQTKIEDLSSEVELLTQIISKTSSCYQN